MTYENFLSAILLAVKAQAGPEVSVSIQKVLKNNGIEMDGLCIREKDSPFAPAVYLESYYEEALKGTPVSEIASSILETSADRRAFSPELDTWIYDFSQVSEKVAFRLVSSRKNEALLSSVPHIRFLDLALIFYLILEQKEDGQMTVLIRNEHASLWGTDSRELYRLAEQNTPRLLPAKIEPIENFLFSVPKNTLTQVLDREALTCLFEEASPVNLYILTNSAGLYGAACMFYPDILKDFAALTGDDLFILPSSIHEVLLSPVNKSLTVEETNQMICEINRLEVSAEEQLSDHVYYYQASCDRISLPLTVSASDGKWNPQ